MGPALSLVVCWFLFIERLVHGQNTPNTSWPFQSFKTTTFKPPVLRITKTGPTANGYLFFAPSGPTAIQTAPVIMTDDNELIWNGPDTQAFNFGVQKYEGKQVLVYWNGTVYREPVGRGSGSVFILDHTYALLAEVSLYNGVFETLIGPSNSSNVDLHEIYITPRNTLLVTANNVTTADLSSLGGPEDGYVVDSQVYELDIATSKILFAWSALNHSSALPLSSSVYPLGSEGFTGTAPSNAWGYSHINSVAPLPYDDEDGGDTGYILSFRYLCAAVALDKTGKVLWVLQGRSGGDFSLPANATFCYQHDIRPYNVTRTHATISLHDNSNCPIDNGTHPTSGLVLSLDLTHKSAHLIHRYTNPHNPIYAPAQGSVQYLPNKNILLGHGYIPSIEEYPHNAPSSPVLTAQFGSIIDANNAGVLSYRTFRQPWIGCPSTQPAVYTAIEDNQVAVYVSWNGATEVDTWTVHGGEEQDELKVLATVPKTGFETRVLIGLGTAFVQVEGARLKEESKEGKEKRCHYRKGRKSAVFAVAAKAS